MYSFRYLLPLNRRQATGIQLNELTTHRLAILVVSAILKWLQEDWCLLGQGPARSPISMSVALHFGPPWQTCLTPFDQLYVLLFLPMKLRCDLVFWDYFTWGRDGLWHVRRWARTLWGSFVGCVCSETHLQLPALWRLISLLVRSFVNCIMLFVVRDRVGN